MYLYVTETNFFTKLVPDNPINDPDFVPTGEQVKFKEINQAALDALVTIGGTLNKKLARKIAGFCKKNKWLQHGVKISYRDRESKFSKYFKEEKVNFEYEKVINKKKQVVKVQNHPIIFCNDIEGLFNEFGFVYDVTQWRLFIDSNKASFKAILLHNEVDLNLRKPGIIVAYSESLAEVYPAMKIVLNLIKYDNYDWFVSGDVKVIEKNIKFPVYIMVNFIGNQHTQRHAGWRIPDVCVSSL